MGWDGVSREELSEDFMVEHANQLDWSYIMDNRYVSEWLIEEVSEWLNWSQVCLNQILSEEFMEKHISKMDWDWVSSCQALSYKFIVKHIQKIDLLLLDHNKKTTITRKQMEELTTIKHGKEDK